MFLKKYRKLEINVLSPEDFLNLEEIKTIIEDPGKNDWYA
jgi:hypothetical protein